MQLSDIQSEVRQRIGLSDNDSFVSDAILTDLINASIRYVNMMADWDWLVKQGSGSLVVDQREYSLAADTRSVLHVYIDDTVLQRLQPADLQRYSNYKQLPTGYAVFNSKLIFNTKPQTTDTYTYYYLKTETALSGATDEPAMPDWAIDLVVARAAHMVAVRLRDNDMKRMIETELTEAIRLARRESQRARRAVRPMTRTDW